MIMIIIIVIMIIIVIISLGVLFIIIVIMIIINRPNHQPSTVAVLCKPIHQLATLEQNWKSAPYDPVSC